MIWIIQKLTRYVSNARSRSSIKAVFFKSVETNSFAGSKKKNYFWKIIFYIKSKEYSWFFTHWNWVFISNKERFLGSVNRHVWINHKNNKENNLLYNTSIASEVVNLPCEPFIRLWHSCATTHFKVSTESLHRIFHSS